MKQEELYLKNILDAVNKVIEYSIDISCTADMNINSLTSDAILMQLIHIGETTRKMVQEYGNDNELPIFEMISLRNFVAHDYLGLNYEILYDVIVNEIPKIQRLVEKKLS